MDALEAVTVSGALVTVAAPVAYAMV